MFNNFLELQQYIKSHNIMFLDFCFTDFFGTFRHKTYCASALEQSWFEQGVSLSKMSDVLLMPQLNTSFYDPFTAQQTLTMLCDVLEKDCVDWRGFCRKVSQSAQDSLGAGGFEIAVRFFILNNAHLAIDNPQIACRLEGEKGPDGDVKNFSCAKRDEREGKFLVAAPFDDTSELRYEILSTMQSMGIKTVSHGHGEMPAGGEVVFKADNLLDAADKIQLTKYVARNTANVFGKSITFMPRIQNDVVQNQNISLGCFFNQKQFRFLQNIVTNSEHLCIFASRISSGLLADGEKFVWIRADAVPNAIQKDKLYCELRFIEGTSNPYAALSAVFFTGIGDMAADGEDFSASGFVGEYFPTHSYVNYFAQYDNVCKEDVSLIMRMLGRDCARRLLERKVFEIKKLSATINPVEFMFYYNL